MRRRSAPGVASARQRGCAAGGWQQRRQAGATRPACHLRLPAADACGMLALPAHPRWVLVCQLCPADSASCSRAAAACCAAHLQSRSMRATPTRCFAVPLFLYCVAGWGPQPCQAATASFPTRCHAPCLAQPLVCCSCAPTSPLPRVLADLRPPALLPAPACSCATRCLMPCWTPAWSRTPSPRWPARPPPRPTWCERGREDAEPLAAVASPAPPPPCPAAVASPCRRLRACPACAPLRRRGVPSRR